MKGKKTVFITQTAVCLALLISAQFAARSLGQFVPGSAVNFILFMGLFLINLRGGLIIAVLSPFLAFLAGVGPAFIQIVPFVSAGNALLLFIASAVTKHVAAGGKKNLVISAAGLIAAVAAKALFLWAAITRFALPLITDLNEKQIAVISAAFSWPQAVTGLIGGTAFLCAAPLVKRAFSAMKR